MTERQIERQLYTVREFCQRNSIGKTKFFELMKKDAFQVVRLDGRLMVPAWSEREWHATLAPRKNHRPSSETERTSADPNEPTR